MQHTLTVSLEDEGQRIDSYLAEAIDEVPSREFIKKLITSGRVLVGGKAVKSNYKIHADDVIAVDIVQEDYPDERILPEPMNLDIIYEDQWMAVINKPIGITVHPASGHYSGTLINGLLHHFQTLSDVNGHARPGIVHRLDKETSGVLIVAKENRAHVRIARQFEKHRVKKQYLAVVKGHVQFEEGIVDAPIGDHGRFHDYRQIVGEGEGRAAVTRYAVRRRLQSYDGTRKGEATLVALYPQTGRTHQLRLHMKHLGHPILGDDKYGSKQLFPRLALHAQAIGLKHPETNRWMEWSTVPPAEFRFALV